jgi:hypothetical protein
MLIRVLPFVALVLGPVPARAQLSPTTVGGLPLWADSALRAKGLDQRFTLSSRLNPVYEVGDFDRDGLLDVAVEVKDAGGLGCGVVITHRIDRSVHLVGAGEPVSTGTNQLICGQWGLQAGRRVHRHAAGSPDLLWATDVHHQTGWLVWDGRGYVWVWMD